MSSTEITKHYNFVFSFGIDFINEFFKIDNRFKNNYSNKLLKFINHNKLFNSLVSKYADKGLAI